MLNSRNQNQTVLYFPAPMVHPCIFGAYKGLITYIFCPKTIGDRSSMYEIAMRT